MSNIDFATTFQNARKDKGLSLRELESISGISRTAIMNIEENYCSIRLINLFNYLNALGLSMYVGKVRVANEEEALQKLTFAMQERNLSYYRLSRMSGIASSVMTRATRGIHSLVLTSYVHIMNTMLIDVEIY